MKKSNIVLLRPEPGLSASKALLNKLDIEPVECPLMRIEPVDWSIPDLAQFDTLLFTSAIAPEMAAQHAEYLSTLTVVAVGEKTAEAARAAGFTVATVGSGNVDALLARLPKSAQILHLCALNFRRPTTGHRVFHLPVYRGVSTNNRVPLDGPQIYMVHSPRLAALLAAQVPEDQRGDKIVVAISPAAGKAAGTGWKEVTSNKNPSDVIMISLAATLWRNEFE